LANYVRGVRERLLRERRREGVIRVERVSLEPEVISKRVVDTTPLLEKFRLFKPEFVIIPCLNFGVRLRCRRITRYIPPIIDFDMTPLKITNLKFHVWGLWLEGEVVSRFDNRSEEGQKCVDEECEPVSGSADLLGEFYHLMKSLDLDKVLDEMRDTIRRTFPKTWIDIETRFEVRGWGEVIWDLINLLVTGKIRTYDGIDVTVKYIWRDETRTVKKHFDIEVWLPVEGDISWEW